MFVDTKPFELLKPGEYIGLPFGEIIILKEIPDSEKKPVQEKYRQWWAERQKEILGIEKKDRG